MRNDIVISEEDIYVDIISGFKEGETLPNYGILKRKVKDGVYVKIVEKIIVTNCPMPIF
jgi:hypothetical protein